MYQLFTKVFNSSNAVIKPPEFELIKRTYEAQLLNITSYYHNRVYSVKSNHLLCRLLTTATVPIQYDLDRYLDTALSRSSYIAKHFNFTSSINYGNFFDGVFYGGDNKELIIYNEDDFDLIESAKNWKDIQAVKVLEHPFSDLGLLLPNGNKHSSDEGIVVVTINLPLLLIQYRGFQLQQLNNTEGLLGVSHFVHMYVLPNMLYSHLELCIMNRIMNLFYGAPMGDSLKHHPFPLINYSNKIDKVLNIVEKRIKTHKMLYFSVLKNIPSIVFEDMQESLIMPDIARTRQAWWALLFTRLRIIKFIIDISGKSGIAMNRSYINKLQIDLKRLLDENILKSKLPNDIYFDTIFDINELVSM